MHMRRISIASDTQINAMLQRRWNRYVGSNNAPLMMTLISIVKLLLFSQDNDPPWPISTAMYPVAHCAYPGE